MASAFIIVLVLICYIWGRQMLIHIGLKMHLTHLYDWMLNRLYMTWNFRQDMWWLCHYFKFIFLRSFSVKKCHMNTGLILNGYRATDTLNSWRREWHRTQIQMYFQQDGAPHISVDMWWSTCMSSSVTSWLGKLVQSWPLWSQNLTLPRCMGLHEKRGVWTQSKQKRGTTSLNFWYCKTQEWP
jgi:hypothetical protein